MIHQLKYQLYYEKSTVKCLLLSAISTILAILLVLFSQIFHLVIPFVLLAIYSMGWLGGENDLILIRQVELFTTLMKEVKI